jgi:putative ABC transport system substrate-binding protein
VQASSVDNGQDKIGLGIRAANWRAPEAGAVVVRRRELISLLGGSMVWPLQARAQQPTRRIGMLIGYAEDDPQIQARLAAFRQGLESNGWKEGRNINIDYRFAPAGPDQAQVFAKELVALQPDVLVGNSTPATAALLRETRSIPIVFVGVSDPVGSHFAASIARPGGSTTGFTNFAPSMIGKWLEMLKQVAPGIAQAAVIFNPKTAPGGGSFFLEPFEEVARSFAVEPIAAPVKDADEIASAVAAMASKPGGSLIVMPDAFTTVHRQLIILLSARHALPAIYPYRYQAVEGGLLSYGVDDIDLMRRAAPYVDRILKGEKAADLPVQAPIKFDLVVNLRAAKVIGVTVPPTLIALADQVIE